MSKRAILNITSRKKRDTMRISTNITAASQMGSTTFAPTDAIIIGGTKTSSPIIWCATARDNSLTNTGGNVGTIIAEATRTATSCFMRGVKEVVQIQVSDGAPWLWRRICFTYKGLNAAMPAIGGFQLFFEQSNGFTRCVNMTPNNTYKDTLEGLLFKGIRNSDWLDAMTAPIDTRRVTVKYDKTRTLASGNEQGMIRKFNLYHPMNKTIVYDDDEAGGGENIQYFSVQDKAGMGDYFIVDYFQPRIGSTSAQQLAFSVEASLYWHER